MRHMAAGNIASVWARIRKAVALLGPVVTIFLICLPAFSQGTAGRILGDVTDSNGGLIAGATVTVLDTQRGDSRTLITDSAGAYSAPNLLPSTYTVTAASAGFKTAQQVNLLLEVGRDLRIDFVLQPGEQQQTVTVTTEAPLIETTNAELGGTVQSEIIENLPLNGRNFENLLQLRPGVTVMPGGAEFGQSTNGMRALDNVFMVNGINATEPWIGVSIMNSNMVAGDAGTILPVDAIDEFKTEENPRAEYGWRPGGIVNVGVKSGTNAIHGSAYAYGRDTALDARNYFDVAPAPKAPLGLEQFGGTMGAPIVKDKLFIFVNYEGQMYDIGNPVLHNFPFTSGSAGTASNNLVKACDAALTAGKLTALSAELAGLSATTCAPVPGEPTNGPLGAFQGLFPVNSGTTTQLYTALPNGNSINGGLVKIDYHLNDKNSLQGMYFISNGDNLAVDSPTTEVTSQWFSQLHARAQTLSGSWTYTPSSTWVNEARAGMGRYIQSYVTNDSTENPANYSFNGANFVMPTGVTNPSYFGMPGISITGLSNRNGIGGSFYKIVGPDTALTFLDHISFLKGAHAFKFGGEFLPNYALEDVTSNAKGPVSFTGYTNFFEGIPSSASLMTGNPVRHLSDAGYALFFQDDWRVRRTVILNLGLRYEYTSVVKDSSDGLGNFDPNKGLVQVGDGITAPYKGDYGDFAPRLGLAWDVRGNGKTVVRIGTGIIYESQLAFDVTNGVGNLLGLRTIPTGLPLYNAGSTTPLPTVGNINLASTTYKGTALAPVESAWQLFNPANPISTTGTGNIKGTGPNLPLYSTVASPACGDGFTIPTSPAGFLKAPAPCSIVAIDPNLRTPYVENWNIGIERSITSKVSLDLTYVGNHAVKLLGKLDINQPQFIDGFGPGWGNPANTASPAGMCIASGPTYSNCAPSATAEQAARPFTAPCAASIPALGVGNTPGGVFNPNNSCFSYLQNITLLNNGDSSSYNGLQATLTMRAYHGLSLTGGYTYAHALGEASDQGVPGGGELPVPLNSYGSNRGQLWAPTGFDIRHRGTVSVTYAVPGRDGYGQVLRGWTVNAIVLMQSGLPMWMADTTNDFSGTGEAIGSQTGSTGESWNFYGNPSDFTPVHGWTNTNCTASGCAGGLPYYTSGPTFAQCQTADAAHFSGNQLLLADASLTNLGCYAVGNSVLVPPPYGSPGTTGRNIWRAAPFYNVDMSIAKAFKFGDRYGAEFRAEFFNIFNTPDFANPSSSFSGFQDPNSRPFLFNGETPDVASSNPQIGSGGSRSIQLGLKLMF